MAASPLATKMEGWHLFVLSTPCLYTPCRRFFWCGWVSSFNSPWLLPQPPILATAPIFMSDYYSLKARLEELEAEADGAVLVVAQVDSAAPVEVHQDYRLPKEAWSYQGFLNRELHHGASSCHDSGVEAEAGSMDDLDEARKEYDQWWQRGEVLQARYDDAASRILTQYARLVDLLAPWNVSSPSPPIDVPAPVHSCSTSRQSSYAGAPLPQLWLQPSDTCTVTPSATPSPSQSVANRQVATCAAVRKFVDLDRCRSDVRYWKLLDALISGSLIPEERRIDAELCDAGVAIRQAAHINTLLHAGLWVRVGAALASERQRIENYIKHASVQAQGNGKPHADTTLITSRIVQKRVVQSLSNSFEACLHTLRMNFGVRRNATTTQLVESEKGASPESEGDFPESLYPLTSALSARILSRLVVLAEDTTWIRKGVEGSAIPSADAPPVKGGSSTAAASPSAGSMDEAQLGLSAVLYLRDAIARHRPPTNVFSAVANFDNLAELSKRLAMVEADAIEAIALLRDDVATEGGRWVVGAHK